MNRYRVLKPFCLSTIGFVLFKFSLNALNGKTLLVSIIENTKSDAYFRSGLVKLRIALPRRVRKGIRILSRRVKPP